MFVNTTLRRNTTLIDWAADAHRRGIIRANTYVIDLDSVKKNAAMLAKEAKNNKLGLYFMTKQIGRNPVICDAIVRAGIERAVAVNMTDARVLHKNGIKIGHIGHLVQIPASEMNDALNMQPDVITVMDIENAQKVSLSAAHLGYTQRILLRVIDNDDIVYPGQQGGFSLEEIKNTVELIGSMPNIEISGVTTFPCFTLNRTGTKILSTNNFETLNKADEILKSVGIKMAQVNAPGGNCIDMFKIAADGGATQLEPGHAFTGTTYLNSLDDECAEIPAMIYVTEVSHNWRGESYVFGGGFYARGLVNKAIVVSKSNVKNVVEAYSVNPENIDYYARLGYRANVGDTVICSFRTQLFVLSSNIAVVRGLASGAPELMGIFDREGREACI
ncbi:MAG: hypothetical protein A2Y21_03745 [Clostridiales bacterium GWC2_40_7]|nr:MAG: hypothetical protein A2Y21_03745 [Clostridiales bacterium GWC2_40_7]